MASLSPKKPSPLSYNAPSSPRSSPFRRAESPSTSSHANTSPARPGFSPTTLTSRPGIGSVRAPPPSYASSSPESRSTSSSNLSSSYSARRNMGSDPLAKLNPTQLQEMRESFQVLDRDNDGQVTRDDVTDMLNQLGQDTSAANLAAFGLGGGAAMNLPTYLNNLSTLIAPLSSREELNAAFSAFDNDDSGQIDVDELRDALLQTSAEDGNSLSPSDLNAVLRDFTGRRAFAKGMVGMDAGKRGEVFRYQEFVAGLVGGGAKAAAAHGQGQSQAQGAAIKV